MFISATLDRSMTVVGLPFSEALLGPFMTTRSTDNDAEAGRTSYKWLAVRLAKTLQVPLAFRTGPHSTCHLTSYTWILDMYVPLSALSCHLGSLQGS